MRDVQEFIEGLAADERIIVKRLRHLILDTDPRIVEKLSYGVPYFFRNRRLFFLGLPQRFRILQLKKRTPQK